LADEADRGNDTAELYLAAALRKVKAPAAITGAGLCFNCGADIEGDARWCDIDCRADYEKREARK